MPLVPYTKPHLQISDQIDLLERRGMTIGDRALAADCLERFGYYRLSGYWFPMRASRMHASPEGVRTEILNEFRPGAQFRTAVDLCIFDKRLRLLMTDVIERIEVALRVDVAHLIGARGAWSHLDSAQLHGNFAVKTDPKTGRTRHDEWKRRLSDAEARSKEDYVVHFRRKYSSPLPIWISIELWEFGTLSVFLNGMKVSDQDALAGKYGLARRELLTSWVRALNHVRNISAHHSRLWNRSPADQPKPPRQGETPLLDHLATDTFAQTRLYAIAATTQFLLRTINPRSTWAERLKAHSLTFPSGQGIAFGQSGFPDGWADLELWRPPS